MSQKLKIPNQLAYSASIRATRFAFYGSSSGDPSVKTPVAVCTHGLRGPIGVYHRDARTADAGRDTNRPSSPNPQRVERAFLGLQEDTLITEGAVQFNNSSQHPHSNNDASYADLLKRTTQRLVDREVFLTIAARNVANIARGLFLWRNLISGLTNVTVSVEGLGEHTFNATALLEREGYGLEIFGPEDREFAEQLARRIVETVTHPSEYSLALWVNVRTRTRMAPGAEVFPSQLMPAKKPEEGDTRRLLAFETVPGTDIRQALLNAEKITNRIKLVDTWYGENARPLSTTVYGSDLTNHLAHRMGGTLEDASPSMWSCLHNLQGLHDSLEAEALSPHAYYFAAMLLQGGMFAVSEKEQGFGEAKPAKAAKVPKGKAGKADKEVAAVDDSAPAAE